MSARERRRAERAAAAEARREEWLTLTLAAAPPPTRETLEHVYALLGARAPARHERAGQDTRATQTRAGHYLAAQPTAPARRGVTSAETAGGERRADT